MPDDDAPSGGRRISRRGRGFMFSSPNVSDSTASEGGTVAEAEPLDARVERQAVARLSAPRPTPQPADESGLGVSPAEEFNPRSRMEQVRERATEYEREYRLKLLHRLLMRNVPMDEIAAQLGRSISQLYRDRDELKKRLAEEAKSLTANDLIGDSKGYYEEVAGMSMRAASMANLPMPMRLAAMRTALAAKNDMHRMFQTAGVYDVLRYRVTEDGSGQSDVKTLMEQTERILNGEGFSFSNEATEAVDSGDDEHIEL